jgi:outer membrane lipoprotein-sorting protein
MRSGALLVLLALLAACGGPRCPAQLITSPDKALASRRYDAAAISSLRAEAKVDQRGKAGRVKGRVLMFVQRPDRVRFDVMTQFGPVLVLSSDGQTFALSDFKEQRFLTGLACERNIARLVGVAISGEAVTSVLLGDVPTLAASAAALSCSREGGYREERRAADGALQTIELAVPEADMKKAPAEQASELREVTYTSAAGKALYRVRYEDYRRVGAAGVRLPFTVRIEDFGSESDAVLRFSSIDLNVRVPEEAFVQTPRAGLRLEAVSCE